MRLLRRGQKNILEVVGTPLPLPLILEGEGASKASSS